MKNWIWRLNCCCGRMRSWMGRNTIFFFVCLFGFCESPAQRAKKIPALCYHNIKSIPVRGDLFTISEARLDSQLSVLHANGCNTVSPDELYNYYTHGTSLPPNPILISFDDTHKEHYSIVKPLLDKYAFKAVFFIMTVCIDKKSYLTSSQIKELSDNGHIIGLHTWDHPNLTKMDTARWQRELEKPMQQLTKITGKTIEAFAYPYGAWNDKVIAALQRLGIKTAFQLDGKRSSEEPLLTLNRIMVPGNWSGARLLRMINSTFRE